jgi:outer membrane protein assembly factor BamB
LKARYALPLFILIFLAVMLMATGCVSGLAPIGWSGGTVAGGEIYVGSEEGRLVAINLADEGRLFSDAIQRVSSPGLFGCSAGSLGCGSSSAGVPIYGNPVVSDNLVYIAGYNGKIYAYNSENLQPRWVYPREGYLQPFVGGLVESAGKLFIGGSDGVIYALDAATGDKLWDFATGDKVWATGAIDSGTLYIGSFDEKIYALNTADGKERWSYATEGAIMGMPLIDDGTLYIGSFDRNLYALDAASGSLKWKFAGENWFWARPVVVNGSVYAGCLDRNIYILNASNGNKINNIELKYADNGKEKRAKSGISSDPFVVGNDVIFAARSGEIFAVDTATNQSRLLVNLKSEIDGPLTAYENVIYVHLHGMTLQRVNVASGALLRSISLKKS